MKTALTLAVSLALASTAPLAAEAKGPNFAEKAGAAAASASAEAIGALTLARRLADYGLAQQDPLALIVAARITRDTPTQPARHTKQGAEAGAEPDAAVTDNLGSVDYLLGQAREFSGGRAEVLALIEEGAKATATKGAVGGPNAHTDRVRAGRTDVYRIEFEGDEPAEVGIVGERGDLDCWVYDENDNLIDSDTDSTSTCALSWHPRWTGDFAIKIKNYDSGSVSYLLLTN